MKIKSMWSKTLTLPAPSVAAFHAMKRSATLTTEDTQGSRIANGAHYEL